MTPTQLASLARFYTNTNSTTFPDVDILLLANVYKDEIAREIAKCNEDYFGLKFERNLMVDRREYNFPEGLLNNIKYVEAKLDGTKWEHLDEFDLNAYERPTDEDNITAYFSGRKAMYDIYRRSLWIYSGTPMIDVTNGLVIWAIVYPANLETLSSDEDMATDPTSTTFGFPRQFHELLARRISIGYKTAQDKPIPLGEKEQIYELDLMKALDSIKGLNLDRSIRATVPYDDGQDY